MPKNKFPDIISRFRFATAVFANRPSNYKTNYNYVVAPSEEAVTACRVITKCLQLRTKYEAENPAVDRFYTPGTFDPIMPASQVIIAIPKILYLSPGFNCGIRSLMKNLCTAHNEDNQRRNSCSRRKYRYVIY